MGIYTPRSFFLPTPSPREVFRKRIDFIERKIADAELPSGKVDYFTSKGFKVEIKDIGRFARVLESVFVEQDYTSKTIGQLSNYNIRRTLELSRRVITSPVFDVENLIKSYVVGTEIAPSFYFFMNALLKGDYELYRDKGVGLIQPVFDVDREVVQSPLHRLRVLQLLRETMNSAREIEEKHLSVGSIVSYFSICGASDVATESALRWLLDAQLIEPFNASIQGLSMGQKFALTESGSVHLQLACNNIVFFEQMALTTAISDSDVSQRIRGEYKSSKDILAALLAARKLFLDYLLKEDGSAMLIPLEVDSYECQHELVRQLTTSFGGSNNDAKSVMKDFDALPYTDGAIYSDVVAVVDYFDKDKGYGFVDIVDGERRVFVHAKLLASGGIADSIADGDTLLCDVSRGSKGLHVSRIHDHEIDTSEVEIHDCEVVRVFSDRGYGFVRFSGSDDAFFHFSLIKDKPRESIIEGATFRAEIRPDTKRESGGFQVRRIVEWA